MDEQAQTPPTEPLTHTGYLGQVGGRIVPITFHADEPPP